MSRVIILCVLVSITSGYQSLPYSSTRSGIWPKPFSEQMGNVTFTFDSNNFQYEVTGHKCKLIDQAIERCKDSIRGLENIVNKVKQQQDVQFSDLNLSNTTPGPEKIQIELTQPCEEYPQADMDEKYNLIVANTTKLTSASIWGVIRGLESFSQLFYVTDNYKEVRIHSMIIYDYPQYSHRGILVDTSRHFLSMKTMLKVLDGMAMNKMNVFHWHIVDDPSFPYQSEMFPELSKKGAYHPSLVYTKKDIQLIVEYARERGIRVVPEIDGPAHVFSWGSSHPEILTECDKLLRPLNPVKNETYNLLMKLYSEVQQLFPDQQFHLGGDEVNQDCWNQDPMTFQYMKEHNMQTDDLYGLYMNKTMKLLKEGTVPIMWEEAYFNNRTDMSNAVVQAWRTKEKISEMITKHIKVLFSTEWYLDYDLKKTFHDYYKFDPRLIAYNVTEDHSLDKYIIGGEACMWGEMVDDNNILSRIFPRASGPAEVLWSVTNGTVPQEAFYRIEEHACRMIRRGYPASPPSGPGFCITVDNISPPSAL